MGLNLLSASLPGARPRRLTQARSVATGSQVPVLRLIPQARAGWPLAPVAPSGRFDSYGQSLGPGYDSSDFESESESAGPAILGPGTAESEQPRLITYDD